MAVRSILGTTDFLGLRIADPDGGMATTMSMIEAALRGGAVALLILLGIILLRDTRRGYGWLFATASFNDDFRPSWRHGLPWLASIGLGAWCVFGGQKLACLVFDLLSLLFVALAIWHALAGRAIDLVEGRRRFRVTLIVSAALYTA